nr:hypothetical protein [Tanacetum cinerariifolium]
PARPGRKRAARKSHRAVPQWGGAAQARPPRGAGPRLGSARGPGHQPGSPARRGAERPGR